MGSLSLLIYAGILWLVCHVRVIAYEEPALARQFEAGFESYRANVRWWIPRLTPWTGARRQ